MKLKDIPVNDVDQFVLLAEEVFTRPWPTQPAKNALYALFRELLKEFGTNAMMELESFTAKEVGFNEDLWAEFSAFALLGVKEDTLAFHDERGWV